MDKANKFTRIKEISDLVYDELGRGFHEAVYQDAMEVEFKRARIPYTREKNLLIKYKNEELTNSFRADFLCYGSIIVELKSTCSLKSNYSNQQIQNYIRIARRKDKRIAAGELINFMVESEKNRVKFFDENGESPESIE